MPFPAEGFQTDEDIVCTTLMSGDTLDVRFKSYGNGQLEDKYGNRRLLCPTTPVHLVEAGIDADQH